MEELFIGYLLNALDEREQHAVETYLAQHPEAREQLALLEQSLAPLAADADAEAPPPLLAERTLATIVKQPGEDPSDFSELPKAPSSGAAFPAGRSWWRRADVVVAICLLLTVGGVGVVYLGRMLWANPIAECKNNLRRYYVALQQYRDLHGRLPDPTNEDPPRDVAGIYRPMLNDAGVFTPGGSQDGCPGIGSPHSSHVSLQALRTMTMAEFEQHAAQLSTCYAYSLGYRDEAGVYHAPGDNPPAGLSQTPIMADRPPAEGILQNSNNHGGAGQNVLFGDGTVKFLPQRTFGNGDDIFVNRNGIVAAGIDAADIVLGHSSARAK
ncbi:MAG: hypothetical protein HYR84_07535 [Planctomycetes bacterium]|nr:hypothetical protein [Planctomycetota bacterium]